MRLINDGCICKRCVHEDKCFDCRTFRDHERCLAHARSIASGEQDIEFQMRIVACPRFAEKTEQRSGAEIRSCSASESLIIAC